MRTHKHTRTTNTCLCNTQGALRGTARGPAGSVAESSQPSPHPRTCNCGAAARLPGSFFTGKDGAEGEEEGVP